MAPSKKALVGILMGSDSDMPVMEEAAKELEWFKIPYELNISSAHRTPEQTARYARGAERKGVRVIIAGAGGAAHLAGSIAAHTTLPVIGIPVDSGPLKGLDSLLSTVQMPGGVPVATVAIGKAGAKNAAILAAEILALSDAPLRRRIKEYRKRLAGSVRAKNKKLKRT
ncbi:MAG: 5-(carboxyamino)imidazole ribonucleotide mutase [Thermodesulfobacteriota bacterium]